MHPRSNHWHLLEYVFVRQWDLKDVLHTREMPITECRIVHRLLICNLKLQFKPRQKKKGNSMKKLNVGIENVKANFQADQQSKLIISLCEYDRSQDILWENSKSDILKTSADVLGTQRRKTWIGLMKNYKESPDLLTEKRAAQQGQLA